MTHPTRSEPGTIGYLVILAIFLVLASPAFAGLAG